MQVDTINLHRFLRSIRGTEIELTYLLECAGYLREVSLVDWGLTSGTWASVAERMRDHLPLKRVEIHFPKASSWKVAMVQYAAWNKYGSYLVDEIFFRGGLNPFTKQALEAASSRHHAR